MATGGYPTAFQHGARRLDSGGRPSFIVMPMLLGSLRLLVDDIGIDRLARWLSSYTAAIAHAARGLGFRVPLKHAPGIVGLRPSPSMPGAPTIVSKLAQRKPRPVLVSERLGAIRISPHVYNTKAELAELIDALRDAVGAPAAAHETGRLGPAARL